MKRYRISARFVDEALVPARALDCDYHGDNDEAEFVTTDGVVVKLKFICTMNNADDWCRDSLEAYCEINYKRPFDQIEYMWVDKLGRLDDWWHVVKMKRI